MAFDSRILVSCSILSPYVASFRLRHDQLWESIIRPEETHSIAHLLTQQNVNMQPEAASLQSCEGRSRRVPLQGAQLSFNQRAVVRLAASSRKLAAQNRRRSTRSKLLRNPFGKSAGGAACQVQRQLDCQSAFLDANQALKPNGRTTILPLSFEVCFVHSEDCVIRSNRTNAIHSPM